jgi:hypothetical protein
MGQVLKKPPTSCGCFLDESFQRKCSKVLTDVLVGKHHLDASRSMQVILALGVGP